MANKPYVSSNAFGTHVITPPADGNAGEAKTPGHVFSSAFGTRVVRPLDNAGGAGKKSEGVDHTAPVRDCFLNVGQVIKKAINVKNDHLTYLAKLEKGEITGNPFEDRARLKNGAQRYFAEQNAALLEEFRARVGELQAALKEAHTSFDLGSPDMANALKLIEMAGQNLDIESRQNIRAKFAYNQPALRVLQAAYRSQGIWDEELYQQVYNLENEFTKITLRGEQVFQQQGSIDELAGAIGKIASLEGVDFTPVDGAAGGTPGEQ